MSDGRFAVIPEYVDSTAWTRIEIPSGHCGEVHEQFKTSPSAVELTAVKRLLLSSAEVKRRATTTVWKWRRMRCPQAIDNPERDKIGDLRQLGTLESGRRMEAGDFVVSKIGMAKKVTGVCRSSCLLATNESLLNRVHRLSSERCDALYFAHLDSAEYCQTYAFFSRLAYLVPTVHKFGPMKATGIQIFDSIRVHLTFQCLRLEEQTQIAAFLDHETAKIDALIARQQELIALLKEKRQAVISHAVTRGLNPDVKLRDSGVEWLGQVPEHWEVLASRGSFRTPVRMGKHDHPKCSSMRGSPFSLGRSLEVRENRSSTRCAAIHFTKGSNDRSIRRSMSPIKHDIYISSCVEQPRA